MRNVTIALAILAMGTVETFAKTSRPMMYEAVYTDKKGKHHEVLVKDDGTETKE